MFSAGRMEREGGGRKTGLFTVKRASAVRPPLGRMEIIVNGKLGLEIVPRQSVKFHTNHTRWARQIANAFCSGNE